MTRLPRRSNYAAGMSDHIEYSSVSASSYDPAALTAKLNEQAADGWSVVAIVPTGGDITAFLHRPGGSDAARESGADAGAERDVHPAAGFVAITPEPTPAPEPEPVPEADDAPAPVNEPAGWAIAPEPANASSDSGPADSGASAASVVPTLGGIGVPILGGGGASPAVTPVEPVAPIIEPVAAVEAVQPIQPVEQVSSSIQPANQGPPAGWYADPAARFELRYWDGGAWTEHVSRAGQQYTDPPVA